MAEKKLDEIGHRCKQDSVLYYNELAQFNRDGIENM